MKRVAIIVEGKGDVAAAPSLLAKVAAAFGIQLVPSEPTIRAGEAKKLRRDGELERYLRLAVSRVEIDEVILLLDLDDGCPKELSEEFYRRAKEISEKEKKNIEICFCVREYEGWLLADIANLSVQLPEYNIAVPDAEIDCEKIRPAKERLRELCRAKGYKPMRDQLIFTKKIDVHNAARRSRSFRKLVKVVTGFSYDEIASACTVSDAENTSKVNGTSV